MNADYEAIAAAADGLYAAMQAVERRLAEVVDANASREAMRLTNTRLAIQKLLAVYQYAPPVAFVAKAPALPPTPGDTLAYKGPAGQSIAIAEPIKIAPEPIMPTDTSHHQPAGTRKPKGKR
jgi:hypothetical protein